MIEETIKKEVIKKYLYIAEGVLAITWLIYLTFFYFFYKEAYFYVDKRLSMLLRVLSLLKDNWSESFLYFILGLLLISATLFALCFFYIVVGINGRCKKVFYFFVGFQSLCFLFLLINCYWSIFLVLSILSTSLVYVIFTMSSIGNQQNPVFFEDGEMIEIKGPFKTEQEAETQATEFISFWEQKETVVVGKDIYLEKDNAYYIEFYIEEIKR